MRRETRDSNLMSVKWGFCTYRVLCTRGEGHNIGMTTYKFLFRAKTNRLANTQQRRQVPRRKSGGTYPQSARLVSETAVDELGHVVDKMHVVYFQR